MTNDHIVVNGTPCIISVEYRTKTTPNDPWQGQRFVGVYRSMKEMNGELSFLIQHCPEGWEVYIDFQDAILHDVISGCSM